MHAPKNVLWGFWYSVLYVFATVFALFSVENITRNNHIDPILFLWLSTIAATLIMHLIIYKSLKQIYNSLTQQKTSFILMIISVTMIVSSSYYGAHHIGTMRYLLLYFSLTGLISLIIRRNNLKQYIFIISLISYTACSMCLIFITLNLSFHDYNIRSLQSQTIYAVLLTIIGAICGVTYAKYSQKHSLSHDLSAIELLSVRYWLVIMLMPMLLHAKILEQTTWILQDPNLILQLLFSSILVLIIPLYFAQKSLHYIDYPISMVISSITPFVATCANIYLGDGTTKGAFFIISIIITINTLFIFLNLLRTSSSLANKIKNSNLK